MTVSKVITLQKNYYSTGITRNLNFRQTQLHKLKKVIQDNQALICDALYQDLRKSSFEAYATEIGQALEEISLCEKNLLEWSKPEFVSTPLVYFPAKSWNEYEPYGICAILAPWNYPFLLSIVPLIGAIAAGNTAIVKLSEYAPHTGEIIKKLISDNFAPEYISVFLGNALVAQDILAQELDFIFFTGSPQIGKKVLASAAQNLTPVVLELGGKSPVIVDKTAKINNAARKIVWGKFLNAGQTCVAPDYILVDESIKTELLLALKKYILEFYGTNPQLSKDYSRIINKSQLDKLSSLMLNTQIAIGGQIDYQDLYISPTVIDNVDWQDKIMQEEIFGPLLPIITFNSIENAITEITKRPKPLALYIFTEDKNNEEKLRKSISFGGCCINATVIHAASPYLEFGGVGNSGMGAYHGKKSFEVFSHKKSILKQSSSIDLMLSYPPIKFISKKLIKYFLN